MKIARPLRAIRLKCLDCSGWQWSEVEKCEHTACILWPLRFGKKPKGLHYSAVLTKDYENRIQGGISDEKPESCTVVQETTQETGV